MKIKTLKKSIQMAAKNAKSIDEFQNMVELLIDVFEADKEYFENPWDAPKINQYTNKPVLYADICPCNPKNGGSGICGCTVGNMIVNS